MPPPRFSFGLLADIQYADKDAMGKRQYRKSLEKLRRCVELLGGENLEFVVQAGDLVDDGLTNLDSVLPVLNRLRPPRNHVLGNHDLDIERKQLLARLGMKNAWYEFECRGWRFLVLDGMDYSIKGGWPETSENYRRGRELLEKLRAAGAREAQDWNGAIGEAQRQWLDRALADATGRKQRAIVFCHFPVLPEACRREHLLWNCEEILAIVEKHKAAAAWINGHDHAGGYALRKGVHHLTLPGLVETDPEAACWVMDVYEGHLTCRRAGKSGGLDFELG